LNVTHVTQGGQHMQTYARRCATAGARQCV
jgi:hypothetical protein